MNSFYNQTELSNLGLESYGKNVLISKNAKIYNPCNVKVGDYVRIDDFAILSGKIEIGSNVHISAGVYIFAGDAGVYIDDFSCISSRGAIYAISDDYSGNFMSNSTVPTKYKNITGKPVYIGRHVLVGTGCTLLPGIKIGDGASIGAMSLVNKNIEEFSLNIGIPCRKVRDNSKKMLQLEKEYLQERDGNNE